MYSVQESIGFLNTTVSIQKEGGVATEQVITVFVQCALGSVMFPTPGSPVVSTPATDGT